MEKHHPGGEPGWCLAECVAGGVLPVFSVKEIRCRRQSNTVEEKKKNSLPLDFFDDIL